MVCADIPVAYVSQEGRHVPCAVIGIEELRTFVRRGCEGCIELDGYIFFDLRRHVQLDVRVGEGVWFQNLLFGCRRAFDC